MGNKTPNLNLPLIDVTNSEDLQLKFIEFVASICGVDNASALSILDSVVSSNTEKIKNLKSGKQDLLTPGENITIVGNVISSTGGVKEEDVMNIVNANSEQTNTLDIGTSETFDGTSDNQIPTSKAVAGLMASAGGGSKLYRHTITFSTGSGYSSGCGTIINNSSEAFTIQSLISFIITNGIIPGTSFGRDISISNKVRISSYLNTIGSSNLQAKATEFTLKIDENNIISVSTDGMGFAISKINDTVTEL